MTIQDAHGHTLTGADARAAEQFDAACALLRCYAGDPMAPALAAAAQAPGMPMAQALIAYLHLLGTEPAGRESARAAHAAAAALPASEREAQHVAAVDALVRGRWHDAGLILEDLSARWPRDLLALQVGHQVDFFTGRSRMLRDRIARAQPHWHEGMPGHHAVLSMLAFGLEENADYARAEQLGRRSVELEPRDGWGWHAVAHVMEMQNRRADASIISSTTGAGRSSTCRSRMSSVSSIRSRPRWNSARCHQLCTARKLSSLQAAVCRCSQAMPSARRFCISITCATACQPQPSRGSSSTLRRPSCSARA
jgi:hypothetical protein